MSTGMSPSTAVALIEARDLTKRFLVRQSMTRHVVVTAVTRLSFRAESGRTIALVGESGCGKSTVGKLLLGLMKPDEGTVLYRGQRLDQWASNGQTEYRRAVQMVFQNPLAAFDPMMSVDASLRDAMRLRRDLDRGARAREARRLLERVGLGRDFVGRYPSEMSGGQLQRVGVARALASNPEAVFLDEPTSALDMSIQGQIINLLLDVQKEHSLAYVLVSHDLRVIRAMAHYILVMYLGQVVEEGPVDDVLRRPLHPYTPGLLAATLVGRGRPSEQTRKVRVRGEVLQLPPDYRGCKLTGRCQFEQGRCRQEHQRLEEILPQHRVRCWRALGRQ